MIKGVILIHVELIKYPELSNYTIFAFIIFS